MTQAVSRYDEFADWYQQWIGEAPPLIGEHPDLLGPIEGARVLDIACGLGRMSRYLARAGAAVVAVDMSAPLVARARAIDAIGVDYIHGDITQQSQWWDGEPFDGCTCELALMDIDDLGGTLAAVATVLRPGGWFVASIVHPCFPGNQRGLSV